MIAALTVMTSTATFGQSDRFSLTLNNSYIDSLRSAGSLVSAIDPDSRNKIGIIELRYDETKDNEPVELDLAIGNENDAAVIVIDEDLLSKIKGQPVRVSISNSLFSSVLLKYDSPAMSPAINPTMQMDDDLIFIRLSDTKSIAGKMDGFDNFKMTCAFGEITIPMEQVAGIKFHTTADDKAVVVLSNGDTVTGTPTIPAIQLQTDWGQADVEPKAIQSLTKSSGAKFQQSNTDFGTRWKLNTGVSYAPAALSNEP
jgi:hypothetical protein